MPHFDYTINFGTLIHLVSIILGGVWLYAKIVIRQERMEALFLDIVRRLGIVEQALTKHSDSLNRLIGRTEILLETKSRDAHD